MSIETGTRLGQYEVQDLIGQGAMGLVYRAYHIQLARTGAVKFMQAISPDEDSIARFRREAQAIAQMRHPNILNVFDFGEYQGTPYMIVEYVPGGNLASRIKHSPMELADALQYLEGIASGLDYAHSLGIVHRDIKPANVLLEKDGTPIIADFGLAKLLQSSSIKSMTGVTTGTPAYMAPEQVTGSHVGPPADRYSLATMAYEMLTGSIPFDEEGVLELLYAQVHRDPPVPSLRRPELGSRVDAVIMRGLAKDPNARWESCDVFVTALRQALGGGRARGTERTVVMAPPVAATMPFDQATATAVSPAAVAVAPVPVPTARATPAPVTKSRSHRRRNVVIAAAVVLLVSVVGVLGYAATHRPTLSLSASTVTAGDTVVVTAGNLPGNQNGDIQLFSTLHTFPFHADANGNLSLPILVPRNIDAGDHTVRICWAAQCRASAILHVIEPVGFATPSPGATPTASPNPTPRSTATPSATPEISISNYTIKRSTGTETVYGIHFNPGSTVTITFVQGSTTNKEVGTQTVSSSGYFSQTFTVPSTATQGPAAIKVCGTSGCLSATVNVTS